MTTIRIFVGTYGRLNDGDSGGKWLALPMPEGKLKAALRSIAGRDRDPEYGIWDSESTADFRSISEGEDIFALNREAADLQPEQPGKRTINAAMQAAFAEYAAIWGGEETKMAKYCCGKLSNAYQLESGHVIVFEKPEIKKKFCFSYGCNGMATKEDIDFAFERQANSRTQEYFVKENMAAFGHMDKALDPENDEYFVQTYIYGDREKPFFCRLITDTHRFGYELPDLIKLTDADVTGLREMVASEKAKFLKRLDAWWKRYGAEGLHTWTYLQD